MKKNLSLLLTTALLTTALAACGGGAGASSSQPAGGAANADDKNVVLWTTEEEHLVADIQKRLDEKFPDYNITIENLSAATIAAKIVEEGENCSCDIAWSEEYGYLEKCSDYLVELTDFDYSPFLDDICPASKKYTPELKNAGCIILNKKVIEDRGLDIPQSYEDLLDPQYKGLISMPAPNSSGTGYMFLRQLTNEWGEDAAFEYFEKLTPNILQYTSSGMGPVNALLQGEAAIGLGMTSQTVTEINEGNTELEPMFFEEGSPYSMYGNALLKKSAGKTAAVEVFNYLATELVYVSNEFYYPEKIFKDFTPEIENYPQGIKYGNMSNDTLDEKERLLSRWTFS